jgi:hypothetical protein
MCPPKMLAVENASFSPGTELRWHCAPHSTCKHTDTISRNLATFTFSGCPELRTYSVPSL